MEYQMQNSKISFDEWYVVRKLVCWVTVCSIVDCDLTVNKLAMHVYCKS